MSIITITRDRLISERTTWNDEDSSASASLAPRNGDTNQPVILSDLAALADRNLPAEEMYGRFAENALRQSSSSIADQFFGAGSTPVVSSAQADQLQRNLAAVQLIQSWLDEDSSYDEQVWPELQQVIEENRLSDRARFHE